VDPVVGQDIIRDHLARLRYATVDVLDGAVDVQVISHPRDVSRLEMLILVTGCIVPEGEVEPRAFAQSFVLAPSPATSSLYVRNDCLRLLNAGPKGAAAWVSTAAGQSGSGEELVAGNVTVDGAIDATNALQRMSGAEEGTGLPEPAMPAAIDDLQEAPASPAGEAEAAAAPEAEAEPEVAAAPEAEPETEAAAAPVETAPIEAAAAPAEVTAAAAAAPQPRASPTAGRGARAGASRKPAAAAPAPAPAPVPSGPKTWASIAGSAATAAPAPAPRERAPKAAPAAAAAPAVPAAGPAAAPAAAAAPAPAAPGTQLFIRGLPATVTREEVVAALAPFGRAASVSTHNLTSGFCHAEMATTDAAAAAVAAGEVRIRDKTARIEAARPPRAAGAAAGGEGRRADGGRRAEGGEGRRGGEGREGARTGGGAPRGARGGAAPAASGAPAAGARPAASPVAGDGRRASGRGGAAAGGAVARGPGPAVGAMTSTGAATAPR
jgi:hypothetical protein